MRRRELLAAVGAAASAGCAVGYRGDGAGADAAGDDDGEFQRLTLAEQGRPPTVCEESLKPDGIRAIAAPEFGRPGEWPEDPDGYRPLSADSTVIGLTAGDRARAYPLTVLNVHEIVNDDFGGPVLVTYCPICRSGMVAARRVDGEAALFDVSGLLWVPPAVYTAAAEEDGRVFSDREEGVGNNGNLVMYDSETGSYWSQMLAEGICGPEERTRLDIRASTVASWAEWRTDHPDTEVLLPPPASTVVDPPV